ncbi:MAG: hypothetical protein GAK30_01674 [Paracidovorax wautersii]|uniref:Tripartite-type tricarboxylate transporter, receptor component TctC n=1 Tax=Paracidovorax wautersii TaxID=1177982 RepID=A0A7V8FPD6_9BURK|nr:MAG: hypothetical protein GAK30_01674 [Paracidovorax wautersii]
MRKISEIVSRDIGQPIVVENVPGASGNIGTGQVARATPDGYTLVAINPTFSYVKYLFKQLPWAPGAEVLPVTTLLRTPDVVVVAGDSPYKTLRDLIDDARARPGQLSFGTGGVGSPPHLSGEAFAQAGGITLTHMPYKGAAEVVMGILSGTVTLMVSGIPSFTSYLQSGALRALAIASRDGQRSVVFPAIPTYREAGLPQLDAPTSWTWTGLAVPHGTPQARIDFLQQAFARAQQTPDYQAYLLSQASLPGGIRPEALAAQAREEQQYWQRVTERAGIEAQ